MFVDNLASYITEVHTLYDCHLLQNDPTNVAYCSQPWQLQLN